MQSATDREHALVTEIDRRRIENERLQSDYRVLSASHASLLAQAGRMTNPPSLSMGIPGLRTSIAGRYLAVIFEDGLFDHGSHFKPGAKSKLQAVAQALAQSSVPLRVEVIGYADDDRPFKQWTAQFEDSLALARASAVVNYFIESGFVASNVFSALSSGGVNRPFPSNAIQDRAKNRTVVLRICAQG